MAARALRPIKALFGVSYEAGAPIPDDVIGKISPQALRALINNHTVEVDGHDADVSGGGAVAHLKARADRLQDQNAAQARQIAVLQQSHDDLAQRVAAIEGKTPAPKKLSKREARATASKE
jgi:hypothetical protein